MTDERDPRAVTRRFRRRVAGGHTKVRNEYLPPNLREEATWLIMAINDVYAKRVTAKVKRRVSRIRQGATVQQSRHKNWKQMRLFDDDDD